MRARLMMAVLALLVAACDDGAGPEGAVVAVSFAPSVSSSVMAPMAFGSGLGASSTTISGSNGVLVLESVHVIVNEFELEQVERLDDCDASGTGNPCREFEAAPAFVTLPLDGGATTAVSADIPVGEYDELEFEIEDLEDDEEDPVKAQQIEALFNDIRAQFGDWPREASMRAKGTFTPQGGEPVGFVVYFAAEIEVELDFLTPFVVTETDVSRTLTVDLVPADWFLLGDGTVMDLSALDGQLVSFEVEIENAFKSVEHDD